MLWEFWIFDRGETSLISVRLESRMNIMERSYEKEEEEALVGCVYQNDAGLSSWVANSRILVTGGVYAILSRIWRWSKWNEKRRIHDRSSTIFYQWTQGIGQSRGLTIQLASANPESADKLDFGESPRKSANRSFFSGRFSRSAAASILQY